MGNQLVCTAEPPTYEWSKESLPLLSEQMEGCHPRNILQLASQAFGSDLVMATGFGLTGIVLMHLVSQLDSKPQIFYLQTDLLFPETMTLRDKLAKRLNIDFVEVKAGLSLEAQSEQYQPDLWQHDPNLCCYLRKVQPLRQFLADKGAWISGIRRDQSASRANTPLIMWDKANDLVKLNPLAAWDRKQVWNHIYAHNLPYNELHDRGYPSIGCMPCTRAASINGDERAGRWASWNKTECGIHVQDINLNLDNSEEK